MHDYPTTGHSKDKILPCTNHQLIVKFHSPSTAGIWLGIDESFCSNHLTAPGPMCLCHYGMPRDITLRLRTRRINRTGVAASLSHYVIRCSSAAAVLPQVARVIDTSCAEGRELLKQGQKGWVG